MTDPRLERLADLVVGYSLGLQPGKILRVDSTTTGLPLATQVYRAGLRAGAFPYVNVELEAAAEALVVEGNDEQIEFIPPTAEAEVDAIDAIVTIWSEANTRALTGSSPALPAGPCPAAPFRLKAYPGLGLPEPRGPPPPARRTAPAPA